jgi:hypothetical protein
MIHFRLLAALAVCATTQAAETPNILFISVEDWTTNAIGCYGNSTVKPPNIDKLAASGIRFDRAYAQSTVCNPSRASFVTGLYPDSSRIFSNDESMDELVPADAPSLAATLATKPGAWLAQTGKLVHKWEDAGRFAKGFHRIEYAHRYDIPPGFQGELVKLPHGPVDTGDDVEKEAFFVPNKTASTKLRALHAEREAALAAGKPDNWTIRKPFQQYFAEQIGDSGLDAASMEDGRIARSTAKLLGEIAEKRQPFFLSVGFYSTHTPLLAPKEFVEIYDPGKIQLSPTDPANDQGIPNIAKRNGQNYDIFNGMYPEFKAHPGTPARRHRRLLRMRQLCGCPNRNRPRRPRRKRPRPKHRRHRLFRSRLPPRRTRTLVQVHPLRGIHPRPPSSSAPPAAPAMGKPPTQSSNSSISSQPSATCGRSKNPPSSKAARSSAC